MTEEHHRRDGDRTWKKVLTWAAAIGGLPAVGFAAATIWNLNTRLVHINDDIKSIPCLKEKIDDVDQRLKTQEERWAWVQGWMKRHE
jgi:hypothetical protein